MATEVGPASMEAIKPELDFWATLTYPLSPVTPSDASVWQVPVTAVYP